MTAVLFSSSMSVQTPPAPGSERSDPGRAGVLTPHGRDRGAVPRAHRAPPAGAAAALLPHPRLGPGRRGHGAGDAPGRLARPRRLRGPRVGALLAVPDRDQPLPERAARPVTPPARGAGDGRRARA